MAARGWFRRPKGKLVYVWQVKDPATGNAKERAKVIGDATQSDEEGWQIVGKLKDRGAIKTDHEPSPDRFFSETASYYLANKEWKKESTKVLHTDRQQNLGAPVGRSGRCEDQARGGQSLAPVAGRGRWHPLQVQDRHGHCVQVRSSRGFATSR